MNYDFSKIDELINADVANGFPGAVLCIVKDGRIIKQTAYGYKYLYDDRCEKLASPEPMAVDTVFDMASNTKIYATTFSIMKLVSDGLLDVHEPVKKYLPEFIHENVLVSHLLSHSAGYSPEVWFFTPDNQLGPDFYSQDRKTTIDLLLKKVPLEYAPGSKSVYSDTGFMILGVLIERITGLRLDEYARRNFYEKLRLKKTTFNPMKHGIGLSEFAAVSIGNTLKNDSMYPNMRTSVIRGEVHDEKAFYCMDGVSGHAGLFSCSDDVAVMLRLIQGKGKLNGETFFSESVLDEFTKPSNADPSFGLGWRRANKGELKHLFGCYSDENCVGHSGFTGILTMIDFRHNFAVGLLTNKIHSKNIDRMTYEGGLMQTGKYGRVVELIQEAWKRDS